MSALREVDTLDLEFQYYCSLFEDLFFTLKTKCEQYDVTKWNRKLTDPTYNAIALRDKRNHYMLMLTICLSLGILKPPFTRPPPDGVLPDVRSIKSPCTYSEPAKGPNPNLHVRKACDFHEDCCPKDHHNLSKVLDNQFVFLMNTVKPIIDNLYDLSDRGRARDWVKYLTSIDTKCIQMKGVRNDYAMLLAGYVMNEEVVGPFMQSPIEKLIPLNELVTLLGMKNHMLIDPTLPRTTKFLKDVPHPKEGAFAFLAVTGDICNVRVNK